MMDEERSRIDQLLELLGAGYPTLDAISKSMGGTTLCRDFMWFFPEVGIHDRKSWNAAPLWKYAWGGTADALTAFAEDRFGNQFCFIPNRDTVFLWSHEDGAYIDSELDVGTLLGIVRQHDLDWIDFYRDGTLDVFRRYDEPIPDDHHLHWTQPLILGGAVARDNVSTVERVKHLVGHGQIWQRLQGLKPGEEIIFKG